MESKVKTRSARVLGSSGGRVAVRFTDNGGQANLPVTGASMPPVGSLVTCKLLDIGWVAVGWSDDEGTVRKQVDPEGTVRKQVDRNLRSVFC